MTNAISGSTPRSSAPLISTSLPRSADRPSLQTAFAQSLLLLPDEVMKEKTVSPPGPSLEQMEGIRNMMKEMSFNSFRDFFVKHKELQEDDE